MPKRRALARAIRRLAKALKFFSSSEITLLTVLMGMTGPASCVAIFMLSPFLGAEAFLGNRISLERDSVDLLRRRGSTAMPMVRAVFLWMPAACREDSSRVKPRPARTLVWYLIVGHLTCGLSGPFSPADLSGWLVEPGADSFLPVFVEVRVQDHSIPAGGHGCLLPCKHNNRTISMEVTAHWIVGYETTSQWSCRCAIKEYLQEHSPPYMKKPKKT
uniref:Uncharacterized protein n=1 Tax=Mastacembelus armatus TaxID=205130 RepID=A0A7N8XWB1_9TELE